MHWCLFAVPTKRHRMTALSQKYVDGATVVVSDCVARFQGLNDRCTAAAGVAQWQSTFSSVEYYVAVFWRAVRATCERCSTCQLWGQVVTHRPPHCRSPGKCGAHGDVLDSDTGSQSQESRWVLRHDESSLCPSWTHSELSRPASSSRQRGPVNPHESGWLTHTHTHTL